MLRQSHRTIVVLLGMALTCAPAFAAHHPTHRKAERPTTQEKTEAEKPKPTIPANPRDLIKNAIENQLEETTHPELSAWREKDIKPKQTTVKQMVETPQGVIGRIISIDGKPLSPDQAAKEDARVNRLLDPDQMRAKEKDQKEDEQRTIKLLRSIPDAFIFTYAGQEAAPNGDTLVNITFTPKPDFDPPTREALVFEGMKGTIVVDANALRLAKIDGTLFRDVNIGWGIIGHLDKGGRFIVEQAEVYPKHWDQTHMVLDFTGKALFFKTIRIKEDSTAWDFKPVEKMSVQQALNFLKQAETNGPVNGTAEASR